MELVECRDVVSFQECHQIQQGDKRYVSARRGRPAFIDWHGQLLVASASLTSVLESRINQDAVKTDDEEKETRYRLLDRVRKRKICAGNTSEHVSKGDCHGVIVRRRRAVMRHLLHRFRTTEGCVALCHRIPTLRTKFLLSSSAIKM